jgi:hypothetical protein
LLQYSLNTTFRIQLLPMIKGLGDCELKGIEDTENVLITTFLVVVTIFLISTPLLPFKITYAATTSSGPAEQDIIQF